MGICEEEEDGFLLVETGDGDFLEDWGSGWSEGWRGETLAGVCGEVVKRSILSSTICENRLQSQWCHVMKR